jgi:hypothetical protein
MATDADREKIELEEFRKLAGDEIGVAREEIPAGAAGPGSAGLPDPGSRRAQRGPLSNLLRRFTDRLGRSRDGA